MLIQGFSFINKKRQPIVVEVCPYVVLIPTEVGCYYRDVTVSQIFVFDKLEYLSRDEPHFHSSIWCCYDTNVAASTDFLLSVVKDGALDMGKRRAGGKSGRLGENYRPGQFELQFFYNPEKLCVRALRRVKQADRVGAVGIFQVDMGGVKAKGDMGICHDFQHFSQDFKLAGSKSGEAINP